MKKIFAISGSTRTNSSNARLLKVIAERTADKYEVEIFEGLTFIPHFNPDLDSETPPEAVTAFREKVKNADGVITCTPEYIFSLPGSLKNALEWMVSTVIFTGKPVGLITASAHGAKAQEELALIMHTIGASFNDDIQLLIQGIKGKIDMDGNITHEETSIRLGQFLEAFDRSLHESPQATS